MQAKPFAVGVRIEHPQTMIDKVQYSSDKRPEGLGAAEYKLTHQLESGRGVYTFCMCPGGMVVASSSEEGGLV
ncbi:FAD dependent protein like protein, partial [Aduncisulcus paluster]